MNMKIFCGHSKDLNNRGGDHEIKFYHFRYSLISSVFARHRLPTDYDIGMLKEWPIDYGRDKKNIN